MKMMILFLIYFFSLLGSYLFVKMAYTRTGVWYGLKRGKRDIFYVFFPLLNSFFAICWWFDFWKKIDKHNI